MNAHLPPAIAGERLELEGPAGRLNVYDSGAGRPLLLIHSINAAASAAEVLPLQRHYASTRRVFCIDLPGFGLSERSDRRYTPRMMTDAVHQAAGLIRQKCGDAPIDALALSLSCEYLARAAVEAPASFHSLALVSPTGFRGREVRRAPPGTTRGMPWLYRMLRGPGWGRSLFRALTRPSVIRYFLRRTWGSRDIDQGLWRYDILTAREPGAEHAPLYFLSGYLFSADIHSVYDALALPVWACHGVRGDFTDYRGLSMVEGRDNWRITVFPTGALPHFEVPGEFFAEYDAFLARAS